jgi:superfamily II DNA helicase RecQ
LFFHITVKFIKSIETQVISKIKSTTSSFQSRDKGIIYVQSKDIGRKLEQLMDEKFTTIYFSEMTPEEKINSLSKWKDNNECKWMIATTAFGCGIDYAYVKEIIIFGSCYSIIEFIQMSGRGGRDGR